MSHLRRFRTWGVVAVLAALVLTACQSVPTHQGSAPVAGPPGPLAPAAAKAWPHRVDAVRGIHKIKHVVVIMQENRSFDSYFGTFPGADGIPMRHGRPVACLRPAAGAAATTCTSTTPTSTAAARTTSATSPPTSTAARWTASSPRGSRAHDHCADPNNPAAQQRHRLDVLGYHTPQRHPELLGLRPALRAPGPHVRADRVLEPARAPVPGLGVVGAVHQPGRLVVREPRSSSPAAPRRRLGGQRRPPTGEDAGLRVDRPDLPAAPAPRDLGLLRDPGTEPDCRTTAALIVRAVAQRRRSRRASGTRCRTSTPSSTTTSCATSSRPSSFVQQRHAPGTLPAVSLGRAVRPGQRAPAGAGQRRPVLRHAA